jgi:hypothetical protein
VRSVLYDTVNASVCNGASYSFNGQQLNAAGTYIDTLTAVFGCDSVVVLNLSIIQPVHHSLNDTICAGGSFVFGGHTLSTAGTYSDTLQASSGCDSIVTLSLAIKPALNSQLTESICQGGSYNFNGHSLNTSGTYTDTLTAENGCDSIVTLALTVNGAFTSTSHVSICQGSTYNFNGQTLIYSGTYADTIHTQQGCDSIFILNLDILSNPLEPIVLQQNSTLTSSLAATGYQWFLNGTAIAGDTTQSITAAQSGNYQVEITGPNGCSNTSVPFSFTTGILYVNGFNVQLFPNPNDGNFTLSFGDNIERELSVTDELGKTVVAGEKVSQYHNFNLTQLESGIYFMNIKWGDEGRVLRFIITR